MKPIGTLDDLLERAQRHRIFGTKMRSVINDAAEAGIAAIVDQQFDYASRIMAAGLVPIIEPEVSISSPHKEQAEALLCDAITKHVEALPAIGATVMLKVTIPTQAAACMATWRLTRASCGSSPCRAATAVTRPAPCSRSTPPSSPASPARCLEGLTDSQSDEQFNATARVVDRADLPGPRCTSGLPARRTEEAPWPSSAWPGRLPSRCDRRPFSFIQRRPSRPPSSRVRH